MAKQLSFEDVLMSVWNQALVNDKSAVEVGSQFYPVRYTRKRHLKEVDFPFEGREIRGLEQNPVAKSRWALMARSDKKVMQFLEAGKYVAVVTDGKLVLYGKHD